MLISFEVGNFLSFKNPVQLSMLAANALSELRDENTFEIGKYRLLKSAVIYGANASGKSNLLAAMRAMRRFVLSSSKDTQVNDEIPVVQFKFDAATETEPSHFEINFLLENRRYRYGFDATRKAITREWLFYTEKVKEKELFLRKDDAIDVADEFAEGKGLEEKTRPNALFLSVVAQFNGKIAGDILKWFENLKDLFRFGEEFNEKITEIILYRTEYFRKKIMQLIQAADLGILNITINEDQSSYVPTLAGGMPTFAANAGVQKNDWEKDFKITSIHKKFRNGIEEGEASLEFFKDESEGTRKLFRVLGPLWLSIIYNGTICIDELDAKLHPLLTRAVVQMFHSLDSNEYKTQMIFTTHDTNLLQGLFRRDQIWFTEKDQQGATDLYSLAEFKTPEGESPRKGEQFEKNYIQGKYGAIPFLGDFSNLFKSE